MGVNAEIRKNNKLLEQILIELRSINFQLVKDKIDECTVEQAMQILCIKNERYLKFLHTKKLLFRRKSGNSFMYSRQDLMQIQSRLKVGSIVLPTIKQMYSK